jgi:hypothetical protein
VELVVDLVDEQPLVEAPDRLQRLCVVEGARRHRVPGERVEPEPAAGRRLDHRSGAFDHAERGGQRARPGRAVLVEQVQVPVTLASGDGEGGVPRCGRAPVGVEGDQPHRRRNGDLAAVGDDQQLADLGQEVTHRRQALDRPAGRMDHHGAQGARWHYRATGDTASTGLGSSAGGSGSGRRGANIRATGRNIVGKTR